METLNLDEAADYLHMSSEGLRRLAKNRKVPGRKTGKSWVFVKEHLADWISGRYPEPRRNLQEIDGGNIEANKPCRSTSVKKSGGFNSPTLSADEYNNLLGLK